METDGSRGGGDGIDLEDLVDRQVSELRDVLDRFTTASYSRNDGPDSWATSWIEFDVAGGAQSPTTGNVFISGGELRLQDRPDTGTDPHIVRGVNLANYDRATLSLIGRVGTYGTGTGELSLPLDIAIDGVTKNVYVTNNLNQRVELFVGGAL